ncbi:MAG: hypothetical protein LBC71_02460 [Oscillospiraceae bacterium]|jgi:hypothetical protein|nr:hypothetical protein [Oscillospiraceae bacterium]
MVSQAMWIIFIISASLVGIGIGFLLGTYYAGGFIKKFAIKLLRYMEEYFVEQEEETKKQGKKKKKREKNVSQEVPGVPEKAGNNEIQKEEPTASNFRGGDNDCYSYCTFYNKLGKCFDECEKIND